jgi:sulfatase maturation enzyme AslB (radical SAM superfamily)
VADSILTSQGWVVASSLLPARAALAKRLTRLYECDLLRPLQQVDKQDIVREYGGDPWLCNYFVNLWEYLKGEDTLTSYPYNVTIPIADVCNARCSFCTSWLEGTRVLAVEDVGKFAEVLTHARVLGIAGHGEPLAHPHCEELFAEIGAYLDPRCQAYLITNGVFVRKQRVALAKVNVTTYNISLNATTPLTHDTVMGLGLDGFDGVMAELRDLIQRRNTENPRLEINISMVINRDNVHELADFVEMGNELGVNKIYLRTLNPQTSFPIGLNYHRLPPYLHPKFAEYVEAAKAAIARSRSLIVTDTESWGTPVFSEPVEPLITIHPPAEVDRKEALKDKAVREFYGNYYECREKGHGLGEPIQLEPGAVFDPMEDGSNPYNRSPHLHCTFVYQDFIINDFNSRLLPCCYMADVPGFDVTRYDGSRPFFEYWNSPAFRALRRHLREGPLYGACKKCPAQSLPPKPDTPRLDELEDLRSRGSFRRLYDMHGAKLNRSCVCQLDLAPFDALIWPHLVFA